MKKFFDEFLKRGLLAAGGGPVVLAIIYGIVGATGQVSTLSPGEVCLGILSITVMAFIAAGITAVYQMEQLPLGWAVLLHGAVLYLDYLLIYLLNGWLPREKPGFWIFTGVFTGGYAMIWIIIYFSTKAKTEKINQALQQ